jgi:hypothetical protein
MIGRREFITLLGGVAAWPLAARAQQPERMLESEPNRAGLSSQPAGRALIVGCVRKW